MKLKNQHVTVSEHGLWEETAEGFLRCRVRVLRSCIMPYDVSEIEDAPEGSPNPIMMLIGMDSMTSPDSLRSLEGVPVVAWDHEWVTLDNAKTVSKGNVAGAPVVIGPYLEIDVLVTDPQTIQDIKDKKIGEISAAYNAESVFEPGEYDGGHYDAKQTKIFYNHIAVIPEGMGRAGLDVRILNKKSEKGEESIMADDKKVRVKLRNGKFINTDEEGAEEVETDVKEADSSEKDSGKKLEELMAECEELKAAKEKSDAELEQVKGELSVYKEKLDQLLSEENIEAAATEMIGEQDEAGEILENSKIFDEKGKEVDEEDKKEEIKNSIKSLHGTKLHAAVLSKIGVKIENMSPDALKGAFKAQNQIIKSMGGKRFVAGTKLMNGIVTKDGQREERTAKERLGFKKKA